MHPIHHVLYMDEQGCGRPDHKYLISLGLRHIYIIYVQYLPTEGPTSNVLAKP